MIPIPNPPTDNLYKFKAVVGTILVIAGLSLPLFMFSTHTDWLLSAAREEFNAATEKLVDRHNHPAEKERNPSEPATSSRDEALTFIKEVSKARQLIIRSEYDIRIRFTMFYMAASSLVVLWGGCIARNGFRSWHENVQCHQDRLLRLEIAEKESSIDAANWRRGTPFGSG